MKLKKILAVLSAGMVIGMGSTSVSARTINPDIYSTSVKDCEMSYKVCLIDNLIIGTYKVYGDFESVFSDDYRIFGKKGNSLITFMEKSGEWKAVGAMELKSDEDVIDFNKETEKIKSSHKDEILDVVIGKSYMYNLDLIYFKTSEDEFIVPFFRIAYEDSILNYIENGKTYTADEFVGRMNCYYDINSYDPNTNGGIAVRQTPLKYDSTKRFADSEILLGDVDGNDKVNVRDASGIAYKISHGKKLPDCADYNKDGKKDVRDAVAIVKDLAKKNIH